MLKAKTSFDRDNSKFLAEMSKLAYTNEVNIKAYLHDYDVTFLNDEFTDTQGFIAIDDRIIIISFRGTTMKIKDLVTDLRIKKTSFVFEQHEGFYYAYHSVQQEILEMVEKHQEKAIFITGHSLGGACANQCAVDLEIIQGIDIKAMYSYGSPRVYSDESAAIINKAMKHKLHRVVNNNDVVTRVPPRMFDYSHIGQLIYFEEDGNLHVDEDLSWWELFWYRAEGHLADFMEVGTDDQKDHFLDAYIEQH